MRTCQHGLKERKDRVARLHKAIPVLMRSSTFVELRAQLPGCRHNQLPPILLGRDPDLSMIPLPPKKRILLVEDDPGIADVLVLHLSDEGYDVTLAADGTTGSRFLETGQWDALVLDLMLPGVDGLEICRQARASSHYTPIIIISAKASEVHRILGLEVGADDYLPKPFSVLEFIARVRALLRRVDALKQTPQTADSLKLQAGALRLDPLSRQAWLDGQALELPPREFDLLMFFVQHPGQVFSRIDLLNRVWGYQHDGYEHTVNTHINRLRTKIESNPSRPERIVTVWGVGYKLNTSTA